MAWIPSHQSVVNHPKTRKLARRLDVSQAAAVGHLHALWLWALDYAPDGDLTKHDDEDISIGALWDGEPEALLSALTSCGWVDDLRGKSGGMALHDWQEYGGKYVEKRRKDAERKRNASGTPADGAGREERGEEIDKRTSSSDDDETATTIQNLSKALETNGNHPADIEVTLDILEPRLRAGEHFTSPVSWARTVVEDAKQKREEAIRASEPKIANLDGRPHEYTPGTGWRELEEAS